jgi:hypothetical protein
MDEKKNLSIPALLQPLVTHSLAPCLYTHTATAHHREKFFSSISHVQDLAPKRGETGLEVESWCRFFFLYCQQNSFRLLAKIIIIEIKFIK